MLATVEILSAYDHRLLGYSLAVQQNGYRLTVDEFEAYAESPTRRPAESEFNPGAFGGIASFLPAIQALASQMLVTKPGETPLDHFRRVKWVSVAEDRVSVTQLGRAVVKAADAESRKGEVIQAALDPGDPLAYARLVVQVAQLKNVMVVDPYFRAAQLLELYELRNLTRVLTSEKIGEDDLVSLRSTARAITWGRPFEIRAAPTSVGVHDRFMVQEVGAVYQVGSSLNGVGHAFTVLTEIEDLAPVVRQHFQTIWDDSEPIFPRPDEDSAEDEPKAQP